MNGHIDPTSKKARRYRGRFHQVIQGVRTWPFVYRVRVGHMIFPRAHVVLPLLAILVALCGVMIGRTF